MHTAVNPDQCSAIFSAGLMAGRQLMDRDRGNRRRKCKTKNSYHGIPIYCAQDAITGVAQQGPYQLAQDIAQGPDNSTTGALDAQGSALAEATAGTVTGQYAVAVAYAAALCEQGETARAFSQAYVAAIFCEQATGCKVLAKARAIAIANCSSIGGQVSSYSYASSHAEAALIGHCKVAVPGMKDQLKDFQVPAGLTAGVTREHMRRWWPRETGPSCRKVCPPVSSQTP